MLTCDQFTIQPMHPPILRHVTFVIPQDHKFMQELIFAILVVFFFFKREGLKLILQKKFFPLANTSNPRYPSPLQNKLELENMRLLSQCCSNRRSNKLLHSLQMRRGIGKHAATNEDHSTLKKVYFKLAAKWHK